MGAKHRHISANYYAPFPSTRLFNMRMLKILRPDLPLLALALLLCTTVGFWLAGVSVYPFGLLVLLSAFTARILHLIGKHSRNARL